MANVEVRASAIEGFGLFAGLAVLMLTGCTSQAGPHPRSVRLDADDCAVVRATLENPVRRAVARLQPAGVSSVPPAQLPILVARETLRDCRGGPARAFGCLPEDVAGRFPPEPALIDQALDPYATLVDPAVGAEGWAVLSQRSGAPALVKTSRPRYPAPGSASVYVECTCGVQCFYAWVVTLARREGAWTVVAIELVRMA